MNKIKSNAIDIIIQVSGSVITAVGGHYTMSGSRIAPSPWSLSFATMENLEWVDQGGKGAPSGSLATQVPKSWMEKLCFVRKMI